MTTSCRDTNIYSHDISKPKIILKTPGCLPHDFRLPTQPDNALIHAIDTTRSIYKTIKNSIRNLIRNDDPVQAQITEQIISDAVFRVHQIVVHLNLFIETFAIYCFDNNIILPAIDEKFIHFCTRFFTFCKKSHKSVAFEKNNPGLAKLLADVFKQEYEPSMIQNGHQPIDRAQLSQTLAYEAKKFITNLETNIQQHFKIHLDGFINHHFNIKLELQKINNSNHSNLDKSLQIKDLYKEIRKIKNDLCYPIRTDISQFESNSKYHTWILLTKLKITPKKATFKEDYIPYDVKANPQDYIPSLIYINKEIDKLNKHRLSLRPIHIASNNQGISYKSNQASRPHRDYEFTQKRLFHILPIRTSIIPCNICLDTTDLIHLLVTSTKDYIKYNKDVGKHKDEIWGKFFNIKSKHFRSGQTKKTRYRFRHQIQTDGVSVSILLIQSQLVNVDTKKLPKPTEYEEQYIDKLFPAEIAKYDLIKRKVVGIDPNKGNIIYASSNEIVDPLTNRIQKQRFRYTVNQRRVETRSKYYSRMIDQFNQKTFIGGKSVKEWESELSQYNSKTCCYADFKAYVNAKLKSNNVLFDHYSTSEYKYIKQQNGNRQYVNSKQIRLQIRMRNSKDPPPPKVKTYTGRIFRKLRLNSYINNQRSEANMINRFQKVFGDRDNVVIAFGDHEQGHQMKYHAPTKDIGMRRLFRRHGFLVYLAYEFRTSCRCYKCGHENENFLWRESPRPWRGNTGKVKVNGLLRCKSLTCNAVYNRDYNASQNILELGQCGVHGEPRPAYLCRDG
jgi:hypothetical protein